MLYQTIHHQVCSELYPTMPKAIASEEMSTYDVDPNHIQVEKIIQKDGAVVKKILPILIKAEPDQEHTTKEPSIMTPYQPHLLLEASLRNYCMKRNYIPTLRRPQMMQNTY